MEALTYDGAGNGTDSLGVVCTVPCTTTERAALDAIRRIFACPDADVNGGDIVDAIAQAFTLCPTVYGLQIMAAEAEESQKWYDDGEPGDENDDDTPTSAPEPAGDAQAPQKANYLFGCGPCPFSIGNSVSGPAADQYRHTGDPAPEACRFETCRQGL